MNKTLLLGCLVLIFCTAGEGLVCKVCKFKVGGVCFGSEEPCKVADGQYCEKTEVYTGHLKLFTRHGCNKYLELCNKTEQRDDVFDMNYNRTCCNHDDLCNGGITHSPGSQLLAGITLAFGWWLAH